ncbi:bifunctional 3'-5' exonuclease/DNA polymerase [Ornithinimicrobium sufpigmenti]|uniref:bifunctional 3'-5' exonuclease/DNA polymerase n=1 Tax=Ornithinimicrobium sufpigmenti TaxID=2508882 RepID=UPI001035512A|nr:MULTISPECIES: bifunctional 3'-5' exonuclease/DNA polymerase [unclassified Ornithinimicrobium]
MDLVVALADGVAHIVQVREGAPGERWSLPRAELPGWAASQEVGGVRWVWADSAEVYAVLLRGGVRVRHAVDLRLVRAILRRAAAAADTAYAGGPVSALDLPGTDVGHHAAAAQEDPGTTLFDLPSTGPTIEECLAEHLAQQECLTQVGDSRLRLLCHAESVGALIAQELNQVGVPFSSATHERLLRELLGEPHAQGGRPARMTELCAEIREALAAPGLNPDSAPDLIAALRRAGLEVATTRQWELERIDHPVIPPLLAYRKLSRLHTANGWAWLASWVQDDRFRPDWVVGGVVTGRWASRGGGALQLPRQIRAAVRAEPGWRLVVADAAQLEPRVLAAMSGDEVMARAAAAGDLYQGLVDQGVLASRQLAKMAMLGAMYGATSGQAGALMPVLRRAYPRAIGLVDAAAQAGERGDQVRTWLGRTSPPPSPRWHELQDAAQHPGAGDAAERRARQAARDWGRFTRNFVVQGTAAEWALCWLGHLRRVLDDTFAGQASAGAPRPELVYFLHDEVIVHTPQQYADVVAEAVREAARAAGQLLFGGFPVEFPLDVAVVESYDQAD